MSQAIAVLCGFAAGMALLLGADFHPLAVPVAMLAAYLTSRYIARIDGVEL